jgi:choline dehydrogenase-like flavoprotein
VDYTTKTRSFAASAYGSVLLERSNVKIVTGVRVSKILLSGEDGDLTASAVQVSVDGKEDTYTASRQIILAAGVFNTPKLLELSGIGNREILSQHGIRSIIDLPGVGESLQDHLMTGISYEAADGVMTGDDLMRQNPEALAAAQKLYEEHKTGPFSIGSIQSSAFMPLINASQSEVLAQFPPRPTDGEYDAIVRSIINKPDECTAVWFMFLSQSNLHADAKGYAGNTLQPENYASLGCWLSHPLSRGSSHIASADPTAKPRIDPKHLTHPADLEILARHVQSLDMLRNRPELSTMFKPDGKRNHPDSFKVADLEIAKKYITESARGALHSCGTTSMMPRDLGGVVDDTLKVYGTTNLRVVDASIIPLIPRGNIISSVYAVAEKAADIIKSAQ